MVYHVHLKPMKMKYNKEQLLNQRLTLTREDPFCLERFVKAQEQMYAIALQEIKQGQKMVTLDMVHIPTTGSLGT